MYQVARVTIYKKSYASGVPPHAQPKLYCRIIMKFVLNSLARAPLALKGKKKTVFVN